MSNIDRLPADDEHVEKKKPTRAKKEVTRAEKEAKELDAIIKNVLKSRKALAESMTKLKQHEVVQSSKVSALDKAIKLLTYNFE